MHADQTQPPVAQAEEPETCPFCRRSEDFCEGCGECWECGPHGRLCPDEDEEEGLPHALCAS